MSVVALSGCTGNAVEDGSGDPFEGVNRAVYHVNDRIDRGFIKPLAQG